MAGVVTKPNIQMSNASVPLMHEVEILDESGRSKLTHIPGERPRGDLLPRW